MRAITDWYFTAHPPIMHDLHESQPLLYTYSGAAPQNPNLDPILFAELPFFSNFELAQMTKWGMPGVYTHAFMDGWSPGYLGSVAYNHNGMMRMYETQGGSEIAPPAAPASAPAPSTAPAAGRGRGAETTPQAGSEGGGRTRRTRARRGDRPGSRTAGGRYGWSGRPRRGERRPRRAERRPVAAAASRANGTGACRFHRGRSTTGRGGTTPTTCRPACCRVCSSPRRSPTWCSRTSIRRPGTRSNPARPRRPSDSSFRCSAT